MMIMMTLPPGGGLKEINIFDKALQPSLSHSSIHIRCNGYIIIDALKGINDLKLQT